MTTCRPLSLQRKTGTLLLSMPSAFVFCGHDSGGSNIRASVLQPTGHVVQLSRTTDCYSRVASAKFASIPSVMSCICVPKATMIRCREHMLTVAPLAPSTETCLGVIAWLLATVSSVHNILEVGSIL